MQHKHMVLIVLGLVVGAVAARFYSARRWAAATRTLHDRLEAARQPQHNQRYRADELRGLPAPVQRYFHTVLHDGQPIITAATIEHTGTFNMRERGEQWRPFTSAQRVTTRRPGFVWAGRIAMLPGLPALVHDAYLAGEGILHATLAGLVSIVDMRDTDEVARGELMRFAAEAAWYPTALLPSQGVQWRAVDDTTADATFTDGDLTLTLRFGFTAEGLIETVRAEARGRTVGEDVIPTPWEGRWSDYAERDGMLIPLEGEVAWLLADGPHSYWRGRVTQVRYALAPAHGDT
jgi:hypothetical protein